MTIELQIMDPVEARALTDEIKHDAIMLWDKVATAYTERAWAALGYDTWDDYCATEFAGTNLQLPRETRQQAVCSLKAAGLSTRAIASAVGTSKGSVHRDLNGEVPQNGAPDLDEVPDEDAVLDAEVVEPTPITGLDGKTYPQPTPAPPKPPRRRPITDQARTAGWELRKAIERIERITNDDRFTPQMEKVAPQLRGHLTNAVEVCQTILDRFNT